MSKLKKIKIYPAALAIIPLYISACTHHQVIVPISNPTGDMIVENSTATIFKGGKHTLVTECDTSIINEVSINPNVFQSLIHVVSLGTVSPLTIEYQCGKPISDIGSLDDEE
ncbi:MAG: hypothetical protein ABJN52_01590 [Litorimonas sp.]